MLRIYIHVTVNIMSPSFPRVTDSMYEVAFYTDLPSYIFICVCTVDMYIMTSIISEEG